MLANRHSALAFSRIKKRYITKVQKEESKCLLVDLIVHVCKPL